LIRSGGEVARLLPELRDSDPVRRDAAIARLRIIGARATHALTALALSAEPTDTRAAALKALDGAEDPHAVEAAWPHLASDDRAIRYAARVALEWQDPSQWRSRALEEKEPRKAIAALAALAHDHACLLVVDNTFATPVLTKPLTLGADLVMESLTKMIAGHSDVTLSVVCGNDADMLPALTAAVSIWGLASNPFDC